MSIMTHIETLQQKHFLLEKMVAQESARPSPDFMKINHLKKQKLIIKEEIFGFTRENPLAQVAS